MKDKSRVQLFGEVFTGEKQVNDMLDLVREETLRIDSRFLEPACGDGNFLIKVLERKINIIISKYHKSRIEFERYSFIAIGSLYGVEILEDNVTKCINRLNDFFSDKYKSIFKDEINLKFLRSIEFILKRNILHGDALNLKQPISNKPIIFSEWSFIKGSLVQRSDYELSDILAYKPQDNSLFSDLGEEVIIPPPIKIYDPIHFYEVQDVK